MPKKPKINQIDLNTFREAVKGVKPLIHDKTRLIPPLRPRESVRKASFKESKFNLSESDNLPFIGGEEFISYKQTAISNKILRKLRKGQYNIDAILDLHGMTIDEAKTAVESFLDECLQEAFHVALIIHGKGMHSQMPILKNKLNHWLRSANVVLAFCSATPGHGSRGAIYVLLKRASKEDLI